MEKTMGLTTAQAYWYIKRLLKTGMIKKLKATEYVGNKGKQQALYKFITHVYEPYSEGIVEWKINTFGPVELNTDTKN